MVSRPLPPSAESAPRAAGQWLLLFRIASAVVILVGGAVIHLRSPGSLRTAPTSLFYASLAGAFLFSLAAAAVLRSRAVSPGVLGDVQLLVDVAVTTTLVYSTGGQDSVLTFLYPLNTLYAAALVSRPAGYAVAATGAASFAGLVFLQAQGWLGRIDDPGLPFDREALSVVTATAGADFLVAMLAGQLSEQLRRSGETLTRTRLDLRTLQSMQSAMVQSLSSGMISVNARGVIQLINPAAEAILGLQRDRVAWRNIAEVLPSLDVKAAQSRAVATEVSMPTPDGALRQLLVNVSPLQGLPEGEGGAVVVIQDVTEQRRLESAMALSRRLATVGQFAAGLAHELRNPLGSMIGCVELLKQTARSGGDDERLLNIVHREAERLAGLVHNFLQFARPHPPEVTRVDVEALLHEVAGDAAHDPALGARVKVQVAEPLFVAADVGQLRQVLLNLVLNASQAAPGEEIVLGAGHAPLLDQDGVRITVADRGPGVPPDVEKRLFEPFFTTRPDGTGLGLAIVHRIVEAHGGMCGVVHGGGPGATFYVTLPEAQAQDA